MKLLGRTIGTVEENAGERERMDNPASVGSQKIFIRRAQRADAPALLRLIVALAEFEKLPPPDAAAQERLIEHGFGERPRFEAWLAFWEGVETTVGYSVFFETYSTFLATPTLYLEDIFVLPDYQKRGIGSALLRHGIQIASDRGCGRMEWTCLDWNKKAQAVYEDLGARHLSDWYLYRLTREYFLLR
ncbi:MAG: GNAT family N-acetyltransferase [Verrucomicrobiota bacterium]